jgi:hypothetical protein
MNDVRIADFRRLYELSEDRSIVAAHAESHARPIAPSLVRRLQTWGTRADHSLLRIDRSGENTSSASRLQMIRRPLLKKLKSPQGDRFGLKGETITNTAGNTHASSVLRSNFPRQSTPRKTAR